MNKYERLKADLAQKGTGSMKCFGNSMLPILSNPSLNTFQREADYEVGDIVFCKVNGRYIDAHKISRKGTDGRYLISNNRGHDNGWTQTIFGRVIRSEGAHGQVKIFASRSETPIPRAIDQKDEDPANTSWRFGSGCV